ncbi:SDR family oxidoreductase [Ruegeria arenilitoris]|uniref:SDR family oxidoreductase n=1 Tax=Ruegeria arenilitoris TaxID=1173585 RepID=UPI00147BC1F4|nr:SDR family oxidoreductase [Ruegeria arenilitoris]
MTFAITGATGQLGRLAIDALKTLAPSEEIVALARSPEKLADLGVVARAFDYSKPDTLVPALQGVTVLALISSSDFEDRVGQHRNVIEAAKAAGVQRIVYTSITKADASPLIIAEDHKATEELLAASGLQTTVLRNGWYLENWTDSLKPSIEAGALVGSAGDGRVTPATRKDYAEALAVAVAQQGHEGKTYELGGEAFTLSEMAAEVSAQIGRDIPYTSVPKAAYSEILTSVGLPEFVAAFIADAEAGAAQGWLQDESNALETLIGRAPTSMKDAVAAALA